MLGLVRWLTLRRLAAFLIFVAEIAKKATMTTIGNLGRRPHWGGDHCLVHS
jgi:hypothetical protein